MSVSLSQDNQNCLKLDFTNQFQSAIQEPILGYHSTKASILAPLFIVGLEVPEHNTDQCAFSLSQDLIEAIALRLSAIAEHQNFLIDIISQLQPDELGLLINLVGEQSDLEQLAQSFLDAMSHPFRFNDHEIHIKASIGVALYPSDTCDINQLELQARQAMNQARQQGGHCYQFYSAEANTKFVPYELLKTSMDWVLERGDFKTYYQPQFNLATGQLVGAEALIRWQHPKWGVLSPGKFIEIAEETGSIIPLGKWVLRQACAQTKLWQKHTGYPLKISVNLSARQLDDANLCDTILAVLSESELGVESLELELTESALMQDVDTASRVMEDLKTLGVGLAIDDFGVGYSSLQYLQKLTFDTIKIDRSFISSVNTNVVNASITTAIINLAHELNLKVVGEGVETTAERDFLIRHQCDIVQGYYFGCPVPSECFTDFIPCKPQQP